MTQKFKRGNLVRIADDLGDWMSHFSGKGEQAIVIGSYHDQFGGSEDREPNYTLMLQHGGTCSWYYEHQLTLIDEGGEHLIKELTEKREAREAIETDLDWIVKNWPTIKDNPSGATCEKLMELIGITEPWGKNGEGIVWHHNATLTLSLLDPALMTGDVGQVCAWAQVCRSRIRNG